MRLKIRVMDKCRSTIVHRVMASLELMVNLRAMANQLVMANQPVLTSQPVMVNPCVMAGLPTILPLSQLLRQEAIPADQTDQTGRTGRTEAIRV